MLILEHLWRGYWPLLLFVLLEFMCLYLHLLSVRPYTVHSVANISFHVNVNLMREKALQLKVNRSSEAEGRFLNSKRTRQDMTKFKSLTSTKFLKFKVNGKSGGINHLNSKRKENFQLSSFFKPVHNHKIIPSVVNDYTMTSIARSQNINQIPSVDLDEQSVEDNDFIPLNLSAFSLPKSAVDKRGKKLHVPRYMMEYFALNEHQSRKLPEGATILRSYLIDNVETKFSKEILQHNSPKPKLKFQNNRIQSSENTHTPNLGKVNYSSSETKDKFENYNYDKYLKQSLKLNTRNNTFSKEVEKSRGQLDFRTAFTDKNFYNFSFSIVFSKEEVLHSAFLRAYVKIKKEKQNKGGVERRLRIYVDHVDNEGKPESSERNEVAYQDIYLHSNAWVDINITVAAKWFQTREESFQTIKIEISPDFSFVGSGGSMALHTDLEAANRPLILIFSARKNDFGAQNQVSFRHRRSLTPEWEEEGNFLWDGSVSPDLGGLPVHMHEKKLSRKARKRRAKNACKRKSLQIVFSDIGWSHWVIAPQSYEAYQCSGKCFYPLASHLTPTKHAVVQNLVHSLHPDKASRACCVPTKLGPISLLYLESGIPTYNYNYSEMVVLECGCR